MSSGQNPYIDPNENSHGYQNPPSSSDGTKIAVIIVASLGGLMLVSMLICCGAGYWFVNEAKTAMNESMQETMIEQFGDDPVVQEHLGEIESADFNLFTSMRNAQKQQRGGGEKEFDSMSVTLTGTKGEGTIVIRVNPKEETTKTLLILTDGTEHELENENGWGTTDFEVEYSEEFEGEFEAGSGPAPTAAEDVSPLDIVPEDVVPEDVVPETDSEIETNEESSSSLEPDPNSQNLSELIETESLELSQPAGAGE